MATAHGAPRCGDRPATRPGRRRRRSAGAAPAHRLAAPAVAGPPRRPLGRPGPAVGHGRGRLRRATSPSPSPGSTASTAASSWPAHVQAAWHLAEGRAPETTIGGDVNFFAVRLPLGFVPAGRPRPGSLPATGDAARRPGGVARPRRRAAVAPGPQGRQPPRRRRRRRSSLAYAVHPAVADLDLADFHPAAMALTPLLAAAYSAERERWRRFAVAPASMAVSGAPSSAW